MRYQVRDRKESISTCGIESNISKERWRYVIVNRTESLFVQEEVFALVSDKTLAEHITQCLNKEESE